MRRVAVQPAWHRRLRLTQQMAQPVPRGCSNAATLLSNLRASVWGDKMQMKLQAKW